MNKRDFNYEYIESCNKLLRDHNNSLNLSLSILPKSIYSKFSIVGKYSPLLNREGKFVCLDSKLNPKEENLKNGLDFYYGISPELSSSLILNFVNNLEIRNEEELNNAILKYYQYFELYKGMEEYLLPFARYSVLSLAYLYGIEIKLYAQDNQKINDFINSIPYPKSYLSYRDSILKIHGCPTDELIQFMSNYRFGYDEEKKVLLINEFVENSCKVQFNLGFAEIYHKGYAKLLDGYVFYSGVFPNILKLSKGENVNHNIEGIEVFFEKTTYATVYVFTHNHLDHPLLNKGDKEALCKLFYKGDVEANELRNNSLNNKLSGDSLIEEINKYLEKTFEPNQIGVTGNIITDDGILLLGKRNTLSTEKGTFYPSVNGNAEIFDDKVPFYLDSIYDDVPTIDLEKRRIDFNSELSRETYAELKIKIEPIEWDNQVLCISGNANSLEDIDLNNLAGTYNFADRRVHFNIIAQTKTIQPFLTVLSNHKKAVEAYENASLYGWGLKTYKNFWSLLGNKIKDFFKFVISKKGAITRILEILIVIFVTGGIEKFIHDEWTGASNILASIIRIIAAILIILGLKDFVIHAVKMKKNSKKNSIIVNTVKNDNKKEEKIHKIIDKLCFGKKRTLKSNVHPVVISALLIHSNNQIRKM